MEIIASWTGIPANKISNVENENLLNIEKLLHTRVIGQDIAVTAIVRARVGLKNPNLPIRSFFFRSY
jgi:ATP-dependent Clp protease ATP-binding subunit ClpA